MRTTARAALVLACTTLVACAPGGPDGGGDGPPAALADRGDLVPTYPPASPTTATTMAAPVVAPAPLLPDPAADPGALEVVEAEAAPIPDSDPVASLTDPAADATAGATGAPPWADLVAAILTRRDDVYELRIQLGAPAPSSSGSPQHTMNVATFVDVDGDGQVDYELWANLADGGWDVAWFDDRTGVRAYSDDAAMDALVEGTDLVMRFPPEYVGEAEVFRWSLASEYGTYAALGTPATARDQAPDAGAAAFPS